MKLTASDYSKIIKHYGKRVPKTLRKRKQKAEKLLSKKLCSCLKKMTVKNKDYNANVAICSNSIFKGRGLKYNRFSCKQGPSLFGKTKLRKTRKKLRRL
jgi:hypothetical protein